VSSSVPVSLVSVCEKPSPKGGGHWPIIEQG
jgi:hypothetical protein